MKNKESKESNNNTIVNKTADVNKKETKIKGNKNMLSAVLVRGRVRISPDIRVTLDTLKLKRKNNCVVVPDTPVYRGMLAKVRFYVTWGEIGEQTLDELKKVRFSNGVYHLHPPIKGFDRKGIKESFSKGGALGYRGEKINQLLKRMI